MRVHRPTRALMGAALGGLVTTALFAVPSASAVPGAGAAPGGDGTMSRPQRRKAV